MAKKPAGHQPAKPASYIKHRAPKEWNRKIILSTKEDGVARFKCGLPLSYDQLDMEYVTATPISAARGSDGAITLWKKMPFIVGASEGVETEYLIFKLSAGEVHSCPVSKNQLRRFGVKLR